MTRYSGFCGKLESLQQVMVNSEISMNELIIQSKQCSSCLIYPLSLLFLFTFSHQAPSALTFFIFFPLPPALSSNSSDLFLFLCSLSFSACPCSPLLKPPNSSAPSQPPPFLTFPCCTHSVFSCSIELSGA